MLLHSSKDKKKIVNTQLPRTWIVFGALYIIIGTLFIAILFGKSTTLTAIGIGTMIIGSSFIVYAPPPSKLTENESVASVEAEVQKANSMRVNLIFNLVLSSLFIIAVFSLHFLNEPFLEVYISVFTLAYFICLAIIQPNKNFYDLPAYVLFTSFIIIIILKILETLL